MMIKIVYSFWCRYICEFPYDLIACCTFLDKIDVKKKVKCVHTKYENLKVLGY